MFDCCQNFASSKDKNKFLELMEVIEILDIKFDRRLYTVRLKANHNLILTVEEFDCINASGDMSKTIRTQVISSVKNVKNMDHMHVLSFIDYFIYSSIRANSLDKSSNQYYVYAMYECFDVDFLRLFKGGVKLNVYLLHRTLFQILKALCFVHNQGFVVKYVNMQNIALKYYNKIWNRYEHEDPEQRVAGESRILDSSEEDEGDLESAMNLWFVTKLRIFWVEKYEDSPVSVKDDYISNNYCYLHGDAIVKKEVGPLDDIYALGICIVSLLLNRFPFGTKETEVVYNLKYRFKYYVGKALEELDALDRIYGTNFYMVLGDMLNLKCTASVLLNKYFKKIDSDQIKDYYPISAEKNENRRAKIEKLYVKLNSSYDFATYKSLNWLYSKNDYYKKAKFSYFDRFHYKFQEYSSPKHIDTFEYKESEKSEVYTTVKDIDKYHISRLGMTIKYYLSKILWDIGEIEYMEVFYYIDTNHDGEIDKYEFIKACAFENGNQIEQVLKLLEKIPFTFWNGEEGPDMQGKYLTFLPINSKDDIATTTYSKLMYGLYDDTDDFNVTLMYNPKIIELIFDFMNPSDLVDFKDQIYKDPLKFISENETESKSVLRKLDVIYCYIYSIYLYIDITNDGSINYYEIFSFLLDLDYIMLHYDEQVRSISDFIFEILDIDGSGGISYKEFASWIVTFKGQMDMNTFKSIQILNKDKLEDMDRNQFNEFIIKYVINCKYLSYNEFYDMTSKFNRKVNSGWFY